MKRASRIAIAGEVARQQAMRAILVAAMRGSGGHVGRAAAAIGIDRRTVAQYVRSSGMSPREWTALKAECVALGRNGA